MSAQWNKTKQNKREEKRKTPLENNGICAISQKCVVKWIYTAFVEYIFCLINNNNSVTPSRCFGESTSHFQLTKINKLLYRQRRWIELWIEIEHFVLHGCGQSRWKYPHFAVVKSSTPVRMLFVTATAAAAAVAEWCEAWTLITHKQKIVFSFSAFFVCSYFYQWVWRNSSWFVPVSNTNFVIEISSCSPCDFNYTLPSFTYRCKFATFISEILFTQFMPIEQVETDSNWWNSPLLRWKCLVCRRIGKLVTHRFFTRTTNSTLTNMTQWKFQVSSFSFKILRTTEWASEKRSIDQFLMIDYSRDQFSEFMVRDPSEMHKVHLNTDYFVRVKMVTILCLSPSFALTYAFFFNKQITKRKSMKFGSLLMCCRLRKESIA